MYYDTPSVLEKFTTYDFSGEHSEVVGAFKKRLKIEPNICMHWYTEIVCNSKTIGFMNLHMKSKIVPHKILSLNTSGLRKNKSKNFTRTRVMLFLTTKILITVYFDNGNRSYGIERHNAHHVKNKV